VVAECNGLVARRHDVVAGCNGSVARRHDVVAGCNGSVARRHDVVARRNGLVARRHDAVARCDGSVARRCDVVAARDRMLAWQQAPLAWRQEADAVRERGIARGKAKEDGILDGVAKPKAKKRDAAQYREVWEHKEDGRSLCALIHGDRGWLMYLREPGDPGYCSRDPDYDGAPDAMMDFVLSNGQRDEYPVAWTLPLDVVERALAHFRRTGSRAPFVTWHAD
jgi:hypothetical protein